jgi:phytanoyl-CoA hydroxylase
MDAAWKLAAEQLAFFEENGFLTIEGWWDEATIATLRAALDRTIDGLDLASTPRSLFSTEEQQRTSDEWFLGSGDTVRAFFEPAAFRDGTDAHLSDAELRQAVNKIGHNLHELVPEFRAVSQEDPRVATILRALDYEAPAVPQSMAILKNARVGGAVGSHVDGAFLYTRPQSCLGFWWPLEQCTAENGCLYAVPGSHKRPGAEAPRRFKRTAAGDGTEFEPPEATAFDTTGAVPLLIPAGTLVLIHAALVHFSKPNASDRSRHAYSIHVVEAGKGVRYPTDNWLQRTDGLPFPRVY